MRLPLSSLLALSLLACDAPPAHALDSGVVPVLPVSVDAGSDAGSDAGTASFTDCEGPCRQTTLRVQLGGNSAALERVQFGFTSPAESSSGEWELFVEAHAGGAPECPNASSPSPDRTAILSGVVLPEDATPQTRDGGLSTVFLDFSGELTEEPFVRAEAVTLTPRAARLCPGCAQDGGSAEEQFFAFELNAALPDGGLIDGHGFAEHCPSMDLL